MCAMQKLSVNGARRVAAALACCGRTVERGSLAFCSSLPLNHLPRSPAALAASGVGQRSLPLRPPHNSQQVGRSPSVLRKGARGWAQPRLAVAEGTAAASLQRRRP